MKRRRDSDSSVGDETSTCCYLKILYHSSSVDIQIVLERSITKSQVQLEPEIRSLIVMHFAFSKEN
jgi:hypothetical protein